MKSELTRKGTRRRADIAAGAIIVALSILFFTDGLFWSTNFYFRDILNFHAPLRKILIDAWSRGEFLFRCPAERIVGLGSL